MESLATGPTSDSGSRTNRNQALDALRCVAILLVLGYHIPYYKIPARMGWIGVDLFFVLSGFLISGLLFEEFKKTGSIDFRRFFMRRGLKIWPPFFIFIYFVIVSQLMSPPHKVPWLNVLRTATFMQNYLGGVADHTWSLAVEEHFYLLLPLLFMFLIWIRPRSLNPFTLIPAVFAMLAVVCLALRLWNGPQEAHMTHLRIDSLFAGVALGYVYHFSPGLVRVLGRNYALFIAAVCCIPSAFVPLERYQGLGLTALFIGFSFLLIWSVNRKPRTRAGTMVLNAAAKVGFYSYSIYLWHTIVISVISSKYRLGFTVFWATLVACIVVGIAASMLIEHPALAYRERKFPKVDKSLSAV
jgi:peptidoglycan/LPS O-acetylase OafA/YrhL